MHLHIGRLNAFHYTIEIEAEQNSVAKNLYRGVNAHLNSLLQAPGKAGQPALWRSFHNQHIAHIADFLNAQLPAPYFALNEQSIVIRELLPQSTVGQVVARIELLSPSNKAGGSNYHAYSAKRIEALEGGTPLIEIDYLHESPSLVPKQPRYPLSEEAFPYTILVSDPRPDWHEGKVRAYSFRVGEPVKTFRLPLYNQDEVLFALNAVYQHTFETGPWSKSIDYSQPPDRFETYSRRDQDSIQAVIAQVRP
jgi:hypothetical protein